MARAYLPPPSRLSVWRASLFGRRLPAGAGGLSEWGESSFEGMRWERARKAGRRWAAWGVVVGTLAGLVAFAPAAWLAGWVERATQGHVLLADARGSLWNGSAVAVLGGGADSRSARSLPGRLQWTLRPAGLGLALRLQHACCLNGEPLLHLRPGFGSLHVTLPGGPGWLGRWPAEWLTGLGTPWNTLQLQGVLRFSSPGISLHRVQGRWRVEGQAALELVDAASRVATLERLGSYRLQLSGDPAGGSAAQLTVTTLEGALLLSAQGSVGPGGLRLRGEASASPGNEAALSNLLNIIGRRDGARSVIAIG